MIGFGLDAKYFITPNGRSLFYYLGFPTKTLRWRNNFQIVFRHLLLFTRGLAARLDEKYTLKDRFQNHVYVFKASWVRSDEKYTLKG